ncbi:hypothetical protein V2G26_012199 [Clonostachys chloroleuca]
MDNETQPLTLTDFSGSSSTPARHVGAGNIVYWKDCPSVTLAKVDEDTGKDISQASGQMRLARGYVLIFIGTGGQYKEE